MLVGGLYVRGVYLLETNEKWSENFDFMNKCTLAIATALGESSNFYHLQNGLLQLFVAPGNKYLCKRANSQYANEQEAEVKTQPSTLKQLYTLTSTYTLSLTIPLPKDTQTIQNSLQACVDSSINQLASHLKKTIALIDETPYPLSPSTASSSATRLSTLGPSLHQSVTLIAPFVGNICPEEYNKVKGEIGKFVEVRGNIVGVAVGSVDSSLEDTLGLLSGDICTTLRTRLNLLCESDAPSPELPSRIVARIPTSRSKPVAHNSILLCDYVTSAESARDTEERFQALLALALPKHANVEATATGIILREDSIPLVQPVPHKIQQSNTQKNSDTNSPDTKNQTVQLNNQKSSFLPIMVAVVVAIVGVVILLIQR
jgi:hypothetical protein